MSELSVNAQGRAIRAAERTRLNRNLQEVFDKPREDSEPSEPWWKRYFKWETLTVAGKVIEKGWVVPQPLGIALLLVVISTTSVLYWRIIDKQANQDAVFSERFQKQQEMLIRIDQRLMDKNEHDNQRFQQLDQRIQGSQDHQAAFESVMNKELAALKNRR